MIGPAGQPVAVYRHHRNGGFVHLKQTSCVDGAALIFGDSENSTGNHLPQSALEYGDAIAAFYIGKLRIILCIGSRNVEIREAGPDVDLVMIVYPNRNGALRQTADDIEQ